MVLQVSEEADVSLEIVGQGAVLTYGRKLFVAVESCLYGTRCTGGGRCNVVEVEVFFGDGHDVIFFFVYRVYSPIVVFIISADGLDCEVRTRNVAI